MKEIIDFNEPWNFQSIWTCFDIIRKIKKQLHPSVMRNVYTAIMEL